MKKSKLERFHPAEADLPRGVKVLAHRAADEEDWHEARRSLRCTGSAVGEKLGISPFEGSPPPDSTALRRMYVGSLLEGAVLSDERIAEKLADHPPWRGARLLWNEDDYLLADEDMLGATPDAVIVRGRRIVGTVEVKFVSSPWGSSGPPLYYAAQAANASSVLGCDDYALASWGQGGSGTLLPYVWFGRVSEGVEVRGERRDWEEVRDILADRAPRWDPPLEGEYPGEGEPRVVAADESLERALAELRESRADKKRATERETAARREILDRAGSENAVIVDSSGEGVGEIKVGSRSYVPAAELRDNYPDIYKELVKTSSPVTIRA